MTQRSRGGGINDVHVRHSNVTVTFFGELQYIYILNQKNEEEISRMTKTGETWPYIVSNESILSSELSHAVACKNLDSKEKILYRRYISHAMLVDWLNFINYQLMTLFWILKSMSTVTVCSRIKSEKSFTVIFL